MCVPAPWFGSAPKTFASTTNVKGTWPSVDFWRDGSETVLDVTVWSPLDMYSGCVYLSSFYQLVLSIVWPRSPGWAYRHTNRQKKAIEWKKINSPIFSYLACSPFLVICVANFIPLWMVQVWVGIWKQTIKISDFEAKWVKKGWQKQLTKTFFNGFLF